MENGQINLDRQIEVVELGEIMLNSLARNPAKFGWFTEALSEELLEANSNHSDLTLRDKKATFSKKFSSPQDRQNHFYAIIGFYIKTVYIKTNQEKNGVKIEDFSYLLVDKLLKKNSPEEMAESVRKLLETCGSESAAIGRSVRESIKTIGLKTGEKLQAVLDGKVKTISSQKFAPLKPLQAVSPELEPFEKLSLFPYWIFLKGQKSGRGGLAAVMEIVQPDQTLQNIFDSKLSLRNKVEEMREYQKMMAAIDRISGLPLFKQKTSLSFGGSQLTKETRVKDRNLDGNKMIMLINFLLILAKNEQVLEKINWTDNWGENLDLIEKKMDELGLPRLQDVMVNFAYLKNIAEPYLTEKQLDFVNPDGAILLELVKERLERNFDTRILVHLINSQKPQLLTKQRPFQTQDIAGNRLNESGKFYLNTESGEKILVEFTAKLNRVTQKNEIDQVRIQLLQEFSQFESIDCVQASLRESAPQEISGEKHDVLSQGNRSLSYLCRVLQNQFGNSQQLLDKIFPGIDADVLIGMTAPGFWIMQKELGRNIHIQERHFAQMNALTNFSKLFWTNEVDRDGSEETLDQEAIDWIKKGLAQANKSAKSDFWPFLSAALCNPPIKVNYPQEYTVPAEADTTDLAYLFLKSQFAEVASRVKQQNWREVNLPSAKVLMEDIEKRLKIAGIEELEVLLEKDTMDFETARAIVSGLANLNQDDATKWLKGKSKKAWLKSKLAKVTEVINKHRYSKVSFIIPYDDFEITKLMNKLEVTVRTKLFGLEFDSENYGEIKVDKNWFIVKKVTEEISENPTVNLFHNFWREFGNGDNFEYYDLSSGSLLEMFEIYFRNWHHRIVLNLTGEKKDKYLAGLREALTALFETTHKKEEMLQGGGFITLMKIIKNAQSLGMDTKKVLSEMAFMNEEGFVGINKKLDMDDLAAVSVLVELFAEMKLQKTGKLWSAYSPEHLAEAMKGVGDEQAWEMIFASAFEEIIEDLNTQIKSYNNKEVKNGTNEETPLEEIKEIVLFMRVLKRFNLSCVNSDGYKKIWGELEKFFNGTRSALMKQSKDEKVDSIIKELTLKKANQLSKIPAVIWNAPLEGRLAQSTVVSVKVVSKEAELERQLELFLHYLEFAKILEKITIGEPLSKNDDLTMARSVTVGEMINKFFDRKENKSLLLHWADQMKQNGTLFNEDHQNFLAKQVIKWALKYKGVIFTMEMANLSKLLTDNIKTIDLEDLQLLIKLLTILGIVDKRLLDNDESNLNRIESKTVQFVKLLNTYDTTVLTFIMNLPQIMFKVWVFKEY